jgi:hypothetical protein
MRRKTFLNSQSSYQNSAPYTIPSAPTVEFHLTSDSGPSGSYYPVLTLNAIPTEPVEVRYSVTNGSPASGTYTFIPGIAYGILPLATISGGTMTVTLTSVTGAIRGANQTVQYTVTDPPPDFSVAMTPASQSVVVGGSTSYTVRVTELNGFTGVVNFGVSGLPSGVTARFGPNSVYGSGSTTLTINATTAAALGGSTVSVTGTSGSLSHGGSESLSVQPAPDYSVSVSPASQNVIAGSSASYTVTVAPLNGFTGVVNFRVSGLPSGVTESFSPSSVTGSGSTTLMINTTTAATLRSRP